jgi:hypothetical protein
MDTIRLHFDLSDDTDQDDELYTRIHKEIKNYFVDPEILDCE